LNELVDWWNSAIVVSLILAAIAAIFVGVTTGFAFLRGRQLAHIQAELIQNKDDQLALALKDKDLKIAQAGKEAAEAIRMAETEHLARVEIEARVAWRRLSARQKADIGSALARRFADQPVSFWFSAGDTESSWFAADLAEAVQAARTLRVNAPATLITMMESGRLGPIRRSDTGVRVQSTKDERSRQLADAIIHELTVRGFDAARQTDPPFDPNPVPQVWVYVEPRPDGPQGEYKLAAQRAPRAK
jgi:hypothetical protein